MSELATNAEDRKVVSRDDAEDVGRIKAFVLDDAVRRVVALQVSGRKRGAELVDWSRVTGFGPDAVVVDAADARRKTQDDRERDTVRGDVAVLGAAVIDDRGDRCGTVRDFRFDTESGDIEAVLGEGEEWGPDDVISLGTFALVVRHR